MNKIEMCESSLKIEEWKIYFVFEFSDGLYYLDAPNGNEKVP